MRRKQTRVARLPIWLSIVWVAGMAPAWPVMITGPEAQTFFDMTVATYGDTRIDFTGMGFTRLTTQLSGQGVTFGTTLTAIPEPSVTAAGIALCALLAVGVRRKLRG